MYESLKDTCYIWRKEMRSVIRDEGVLIFFIIVPLLYPLVYSWAYDNEVVRDVPVAVVDLSNSHTSRQFIRRCDASPEVKVGASGGARNTLLPYRFRANARARTANQDEPILRYEYDADI